MIRHIRLEIRKDEHTTLPVSVPEWELPILEVVHGPDNVKHVGEKLVDRQPPEAHDEFVRLTNRYGKSEQDDGTKGPYFTHIVWGQLGKAKLEEAIQAAVVAAPEGNLVDDSEEPISSVGG
jgi:hypothetical protein